MDNKKQRRQTTSRTAIRQKLDKLGQTLANPQDESSDTCSRLVDTPTHNSFPPHVKNILNLAGDDVVLIPIKHATKGPRYGGWNDIDLEYMRDPEYARIWTDYPDYFSGVAVLTGEPSAGLCSVDIDNDELVEEFLKLNPKLKGSLRSYGSRGCNVWVKVVGDYPAPAALKTGDGKAWGEWRSTGNCTMIHGHHPKGVDYRREPEIPPIEIGFNEIIWPDGMNLPWAEVEDGPTETFDDDVVERFGEPAVYTTTKDGERVARAINEPYWAGLYSQENIMLFEPNESSFFCYSSETGLYSQISSDYIRQEISFRMLEVSRSAKHLTAIAGMRTDRNLKAVDSQLRGVVEHPNAFIDRPAAVHLADCMLVIEEGSLKVESFSPDFRSRNRSPISFDPDAECPRFLTELLLGAVTEEDAVLIQKMVGQCLLGKNLIQRFLILDGFAGRGKSQLCLIIQYLVGLENVAQLRTHLLCERFELSRLLHRSLLIGVDVDADFLSSKGAPVIKALVGGDMMNAEKKGSNASFQVPGTFNIIMTSNTRLKVRLQGDVDAWKRRMLIVRYESSPPAKKIPNFAELLIREEGPGILNWALEGLLMLWDDVAKYGDIQLSASQQEVVDSLMTESDSLRVFLQNNVVNMDGSDLAVAEIVQAYAHYCPDMGWTALPDSQIGRQLPSLMLELFKTPKNHNCSRDNKSVRGFRGVAFKDQEVSS